MNAVVKTEGTIQPMPGTPLAMLSAAIDKGMTPETIKGLMDLQERWEKSQAEKAYNAAFAAFKAEAVSVIKNKLVTDGPLRGKSYAELFAVVDAVTPALSKHGFAHSWKVTKDEKDWIEVTCVLKHVLGHSDSATLGGPPDAGGAKSAIQARASTISYLERYTLKAVCGVAERGEDTDGRPPKQDVEPDAAGKEALEGCKTLVDLQTTWSGLTAAQRKTLGSVKDAMKKKIEEAK